MRGTWDEICMQMRDESKKCINVDIFQSNQINRQMALA